MEKIPHKSSWKSRKAKEEEPVKKEKKRYEEIEIREKLEKIKKYIMISAVILLVPIIAFFVSPLIFLWTPFINLIVIVIIVFMLYVPISDFLKKSKE